MIQLLHNLQGQVNVLIREPWAVAGMMKRNTGRQWGGPPAAFITLPGCGTVRAGTSPSLLPPQGGLSEYVHQPVWGQEEEYWGGRKDEKQSQGRWSSRGGCDGHFDVGIRPGSEQKVATDSASKRSESSGTMITRPREETMIPHTQSHFDLALGKWGSITVTAKKEKRKLLFLSLDFNLFLEWSTESIFEGWEGEMDGQIHSLFNTQSFFMLQGLMADLVLNEKLKGFFETS